jgi:CRP/FNR family cyclic AMP-dependent transcriptional regulator
VIRMTPTLERLSRLPLFAGCDLRELAAVASRSTTVHPRRGTILVREGTVGREVFIIVEGWARVVRDGDPVARLGPGDVCGEVAVLDHGLRTATVVADSDLVVEVCTKEEFIELLHVVPGLSTRLLEQLSSRLRNAMTSVHGDGIGYS